MEPLRFELDIAATRERVWDLFTTAGGLTSWLCLRARVEPRVGGAYELFWNPDATRPESDSTLGCRILSIDRPRLLSFTWRGALGTPVLLWALAAVAAAQLAFTYAPFMQGWFDTRPVGLADGASEVHKMVLSRFLLAEAEDFWSWN